MNKQTKKILIAVLALLLAAAALFFLYRTFAPGAQAGTKHISVTVVHADGAKRDFSYDTEREYLGEVLSDEELVSGEMGAYGLYIKTVDGETVDESQQQWWCLTRGGGQVDTSADLTPIADGEQYELTLTVGY